MNKEILASKKEISRKLLVQIQRIKKNLEGEEGKNHEVMKRPRGGGKE